MMRLATTSLCLAALWAAGAAAAKPAQPAQFDTVWDCPELVGSQGRMEDKRQVISRVDERRTTMTPRAVGVDLSKNAVFVFNTKDNIGDWMPIVWKNEDGGAVRFVGVATSGKLVVIYTLTDQGNLVATSEMITDDNRLWLGLHGSKCRKVE